MYLLDNSSPEGKPVVVRRSYLHTKTKPSPQEFVDQYRHGLRRGKFTGRMVFIEDYVDGALRRYRIQEAPKTVHHN